MEMKPTIRKEITVGMLKAALSMLPDDTVLSVDLSFFLKEETKGGEPDERKKA